MRFRGRQIRLIQGRHFLLRKMIKPLAADKPKRCVTAKSIAFPVVRSVIVVARKLRFWKSWLVGFSIVLVSIATIAVAWWIIRNRAAIQYTITPATRGDVVHAVTGTGTVNPELAIIVSTNVSGVIQELYCDYNTVVKKGQLCAKIDPRPFQTIVDQNKAIFWWPGHSWKRTRHHSLTQN